MKKNILLTLFWLFAFSATLFAACARESTYSTYTPQPKSVFNITFDYPSTWTWGRRTDTTSYGSIITVDPDVELENVNPSTSRIFVFVYSDKSPDKAKTEMNRDIDDLLETIAVRQAQVLSDRVFEVDGRYARQFTERQTILEKWQNEPLLTEWIFIMVENKYYKITFSTEESKRNGEFGQGFDHVVESIKFIP